MDLLTARAWVRSNLSAAKKTAGIPTWSVTVRCLDDINGCDRVKADNKRKTAYVEIHVTALADSTALSSRLTALLDKVANRRIDASTLTVTAVESTAPLDAQQTNPERWVQTHSFTPGTWSLSDWNQGHYAFNDPDTDGFYPLNQELQFYTDDTNNISVDASEGLVLEAKHENATEYVTFNGTNRTRRQVYAGVDKSTSSTGKTDYGTVSCTSGSNVITGTGTAFNTHFMAPLYSESIQLLGGSNPVFTLYAEKACSVSDLTNDVFTCTAHGIPTGFPVKYSTAGGGTQPGGVSTGTLYLRSLTADTFSLFASQAAANNTGSETSRVNVTTVGSGYQVIQPQCVNSDTQLTTATTAGETLTNVPYIRIRTYKYTSGMVQSFQKFFQRYGFFRWVYKCPPWLGMWPAIWMMRGGSGSGDQVYNTYPEWDILERFGSATNRTDINQTLHFPDASNNRKQDTKIPLAEDWTRQEHTIAGKWSPMYRRIYSDGVLAQDCKTSEYKTGTVAVSGSTVTGTGTAFTTDYAVGDCFEATGGGNVARILTISSDTSMTLNSSMTTVSGVTHRKMVDLQETGQDRVQHFLLNLAVTRTYPPDTGGITNIWPGYFILKSLECYRHKDFTDYATTLMWMDAQSGFTKATGISAWADKSSGGCNFSQTTVSKQPSLLSGSTVGYAGTQVSFASASSQVLVGNAAAQAVLQNRSAVTIHVVHTVSGANNPILAWSVGGDVTHRLGLSEGSTNNLSITLRRNDGDTASVINTPDNSYPAGTYLTTILIDFQNGLCTVRKNGVAVLTDQAWGTGSGPSANTPSQAVYIGANSNLTGYRNGVVQDIAVSDGLQTFGTSDQGTILEAFLGQFKYDLMAF